MTIGNWVEPTLDVNQSRTLCTREVGSATLARARLNAATQNLVFVVRVTDAADCTVVVRRDGQRFLGSSVRENFQPQDAGSCDLG